MAFREIRAEELSFNPFDKIGKRMDADHGRR